MASQKTETISRSEHTAYDASFNIEAAEFTRPITFPRTDFDEYVTSSDPANCRRRITASIARLGYVG